MIITLTQLGNATLRLNLDKNTTISDLLVSQNIQDDFPWDILVNNKLVLREHILEDGDIIIISPPPVMHFDLQGLLRGAL